jgi:hypothetical protein
VAMVVDKPVKELLEIVPSRGTTYKDLRKMLRHYGLRGGPERKFKGKFPAKAIMRIRWDKRHSHWVVLDGDKVHCPGLESYMPLSQYNASYANGFIGHFTSFMTVK